MSFPASYAAVAPTVRVCTVKEYRVALCRLRELESAAMGSVGWLERKGLERGIAQFLNSDARRHESGS